ncbi:hypothetical protein SAMN05216337_1001220 [Bradyrhizobium brasilense]|uniref:Uncharacterized protein n=1 Tax=Bradyrhizobium brasilense TaxID=1419277 RepID=A0A1G6IQH7_9BRAD|nr:hypothetical protein [Bradyrhizobium brasilense]SDC08690.1 hypothetical protein SAMN05216337_1001220 [Bradyrhizobium brasilense]
MVFYVGQRVVCVAPALGRLTKGEVSAQVGEVYTIRAIFTWCGSTGFHLEEIRNPVRRTVSGRHERYQASRRFRPVLIRKTDISAFKAMLQPNDVREKATAQ